MMCVLLSRFAGSSVDEMRRSPGSEWIRVANLALMALLLVLPGTRAAEAVTAESSTLQADAIVIEQPLEVVRQLIDAGNLQAADTILSAFELSHMENSVPLPPLAEILRARLALAKDDFDRAELLFARHLQHREQGTLAHWGLAEIQARRGNVRMAGKTLQKLDRSTLTVTGRIILDRTLQSINEERAWRLFGSFALAPSTNINQATDSDHVTLYGSPFRLAASARETSGVGAHLVVAGEGRIAQFLDLPILANAWLKHTDYQEADFDDTSIHVSLGPVVRLGSIKLNPKITGSRRWYGIEPLTTSAGLLVRTEVPLPNFFTGRVSIVQERVLYDRAKGQNGNRSFAQIALSRRTKKGAVHGRLNLERDRSGGLVHTSRAIGVGMTLNQTIQKKLSLTLSADTVYRRFDARSSSFGRRRVDTRHTFRTSIIWPELKFTGFTPEIGASYIINESNLSLFEFVQLRGFIRVTRVL